FCQAEDGIRDGHVTGVQTCALPIFQVDRPVDLDITSSLAGWMSWVAWGRPVAASTDPALLSLRGVLRAAGAARWSAPRAACPSEIGRASCRERVYIAGVRGLGN